MYLALRDLRFAKGRFALMGTVVGLITFLLVMLSGLTAGLANQSTSAIAGLNATTIVFGAPTGEEPTASFPESRVNAHQLRTWQQAAGVSSAEALGISQTQLEAGGTATVAVFGAAPGGALAPEQLRSGTAVLSRTVAEELSLSVGDTASISGTIFQVVDIIEDQWYSHTPVVWTALGDWRATSRLADPDVLGTVLAATYDDAAGAQAPEQIDTAAGTVSTTVTGSYDALASFSSENGSLTAMQGFLYGISALVIVAFLTVWTIQRTRDIAVLRALGGSNGYIIRDAISQAAIVLVTGAALGAALGLGGGYLAGAVAPFLASAATVVGPFAGIVLLGLGGSALAVRGVTRVDPLLALGGN